MPSFWLISLVLYQTIETFSFFTSILVGDMQCDYKIDVSASVLLQSLGFAETHLQHLNHSFMLPLGK